MARRSTTNTSTGVKSIFVDTGGFIALLHTDDRYHEAAASFYRRLGQAVLKVTTNFVIAETYTFLRYEAGHAEAVAFLDAVEESEKAGYLSVIQVAQDLEAGARLLLREYKDQKLSYTDAVTLAYLKSHPEIEAVFGFDRHLALSGRTLLP